MIFTLSSISLALVALGSFTSGVSAAPHIIRDGGMKDVWVNNRCGFNVFVQAFVNNGDTSIKSLPAGQTGFHISAPEFTHAAVVKVSKSGDMSRPGQYEWTNADLLYYDISYIDGEPLFDYNDSFIPIGGSNCNKPALSCGPGVTGCPDAYYLPDDIQTWTCSNKWDALEINLC